MNRNDINRIFTEQVSALLAQGYQINLDTMRGSQGEIGKVDLRKGDEILRVLLYSEASYGESYDGYFIIIVGRNADRLWHGWDNTIWNSHLEVISEIKLAKITNDYFVTVEEGKVATDRRYEHRNRKYSVPSRVPLGDAFKSPALRWLRKQPRMKSCKLEDIESVTRLNTNEWCETTPKLYGYEIKARGRTFIIKAPRKAE